MNARRLIKVYFDCRFIIAEQTNINIGDGTDDISQSKKKTKNKWAKIMKIDT